MEIPLRATAIFFFLWILTRGVGKRELAELSAFELLLLVTVGDLVQQGVTQEDYSVTGAVLAVGTIAFWVLLFSYASFKFPRSRKLLEGQAVVVVRDGAPLNEMLRLERITIEEVLTEARQQGISNLRDVQLAVLEADGKFSFITREARPTQRQDEGPRID